jgi:N-acetyl-gamma-glutamyl-phosphate reductase
MDPSPDADLVPVRVAVLGASGFVGGELVRLLIGHHGVEITFLGAADSAGRTLADVHPHLGSRSIGGQVLRTIDPGAVAAAADIAFCCLPHGTSAALAPLLLEAGVGVIDLSGDFRLTAEAYPEWCGFEHPSAEWLTKAAYGLPELFGDQIVGAQLVANPGCFPTAVVLGLAPLYTAGLVEPGPVRVDGKTGISGAGKGGGDAGAYVSVEESVRPYRIPRHQHTPEMERALELATGIEVPIVFAPHLIPAVRGVVTTCYAALAPGATSGEMTDALATAYAGRPFVRVLPVGAMVDSKRTRGSNVVEVQAVADPRTGTAIVVGALDNLIKGAAGQAIQNMNLLRGLPEMTGLPTMAVYP